MLSLHIHNLKPAAGAKRRSKRIGRGNASGHGAYSGRGGKGQTARSGGSRGLLRKGFRALMLSTPKRRGFHSQAVRAAEVTLGVLEKKYNNGETVSLPSLKEKGIIPAGARAAKVLSNGDLTKKLVIVGLKASKGAAERVKAAGGELQ